MVVHHDAMHLDLDGGPVPRVSAVWVSPPSPRAVYVLAHGAGASMTHRFLEDTARLLGERGVATLRYNFPYMERGSRAVDRPPVAHQAVRAAVAAAVARAGNATVVAGGKSFGGRMTSQAQAAAPLPGVRGLAFLGFPLHPPGKPSRERGAHLADVRLPMLFLQGTKDEFAELALLRAQVADLGERARLVLFDDADHSFHVPARTGKKDAEVLAAVCDALVGWIEGLAG